MCTVAVAGYTDKGLRKKVNQDSYCVKVAQTAVGDVVMAVVCDGVGGLIGGEVASSSVVRHFSQWFETSLRQQVAHSANSGSALSLSAIQKSWTNSLEALNVAIRSQGGGMGTTFTGIFITGGRYLIGHIGDCRIYRFRTGEVKQLTVDQTFVAREIARGAITLKEAENHPQKNAILQAIGAQQDIAPVFYEGKSVDGDIYLLCCDGFRRKIEMDEMREAFARVDFTNFRHLQETCESLVALNVKRGETDNITAVCIGVFDEETTVLSQSDKNIDTATSVLEGKE